MATNATADACPKRTSATEPVIYSPQPYSENGAAYQLSKDSYSYGDDGIMVPPVKVISDGFASDDTNAVSQIANMVRLTAESMAYQIKLKFTGRWDKIMDVVVPANTDSTNIIQATKTKSFEVADSATVSSEFGIEIKAGMDLGMANFEVTASAKFGESFTHSTSFCSSESIEVDIPSFRPSQDTSVACWQRIGMYQFVYRAINAKPTDPWIPFGNHVENTSNVFRFDIFPAVSAPK